MAKTKIKRQKAELTVRLFVVLFLAVPTGIEPAERNWSRTPICMEHNVLLQYICRADFIVSVLASQVFGGILGQSRDNCLWMSKADQIRQKACLARFTKESCSILTYLIFK